MVFNTTTCESTTIQPPTARVPLANDTVWLRTDTQTEPAFTLSGAPVSAPPLSYPNQTTILYPAGLDGDSKLRTDVQITFDTSGLINDPELNSKTTLAITAESDSGVFNLTFIALHKDIWSDTNPPQVSLFFSKNIANRAPIYIHICIPIQYTINELNTNSFLNSWLKKTSVKSGLSVNNLLDAKNGLKYQSLYYCIRPAIAYTLYLSSEPLLLNQYDLPAWLQQDRNLTGSQWVTDKTYRLKTFSDVYTYVMNVRGSSTEFLNWEDITATNPKKLLKTIFDGSRTQDTVRPTYYSLAPRAAPAD